MKCGIKNFEKLVLIIIVVEFKDLKCILDVKYSLENLSKVVIKFIILILKKGDEIVKILNVLLEDLIVNLIDL